MIIIEKPALFLIKYSLVCFLKYQVGFLDELIWVSFFLSTEFDPWTLRARCISWNEAVNSHVLNCRPWIHVVNFIFYQVVTWPNQVRIKFFQYWKFRCAIVLFLIRLIAVIEIMDGILSHEWHKINSFRKTILRDFGRLIEGLG